MDFSDATESSKKRVKKFQKYSKNQSQAQTLGEVIVATASVLFQPTYEQRICKARFHEIYRKLSRDDRDRNPLTQLDTEWVDERLGSGTLVSDWAARDPRFLPWFSNARDFHNRLEALAEKSLEAANQILDDSDPANNTHKVNLFKALVPLLLAKEEAAKPKLDIAGILGGLSVEQMQLLVSSQAGKIGIAIEAPKQLEEEVVDV